MTTRTTPITPYRSRVIARSPIYYGWVIWAVAMVGIIASAPGQAFTVSLYIDHYIAEFFTTVDVGHLFNEPFLSMGSFTSSFNDNASTGRTTTATLFSLGTLLAALNLTWLGRQIDRLGNRRVGAIAGVGLVVALIGSAMVTGPFTLFLSFFTLRILGMGALFLNGTTAIARWWVTRRGWVMGLALVGFALFQRAYLPALEDLINSIGWRASWLVMAAGVATVFLPLWLLFMRDAPERYGLLPDGMLVSDDGSSPAAALETNYTLPEARRLPIFWIFIVGRIAPAIMGSGLIFHLVSVFHEAGHSAAVAASTFGSVALVNAVVTLAAGRVIRHVRPGLFMAFQLTILITALWLSLVMTTPLLLLGFTLTFGAVMAMGATFDGSVWADLFGREHHGAIRGFSTTALVFGTALGPPLWAFSYDSFGSYLPIIIAGTAFIMVALTAALFTTAPAPGA
ncbi:MAG: MFS transporter [Phototrophicaceae bacterium]